MKTLLQIILLLISLNSIGQTSEYINITNKSNDLNKTTAVPSNDNCTSATVLTIGSALICNQTTDQATLQAGECYTNYGGGSSETTVWYRFTASNDSLVLNILKTNSTNCVGPHVRVYGPFASGGGCLATCTQTVYNNLQSGDPGSHILLTGLATSGNRDYLIQIQSNDCGGANDGFTNFCINIVNPAKNTTSNVPAVINQCGTVYNGTTNGGYYQSGTSLGFNNLDGNNGTTVGGASETGDDVTFVVNNISWFKFCTVNAGTYNVQFDVTSCIFSGLNSGSQMAIFTGTSNNLTNIWQASNPTYTNTAVQTSPNFNLAAGGCAYLVVDGFAGDACNYTYILTNVSGGCILLPVELINFDVVQEECINRITWTTASEHNNAYFDLERSVNGVDFKAITRISGSGNSTNAVKYLFYDKDLHEGITYYRLKQVDFDSTYTYSNIIAQDNICYLEKWSKIINLLGQEVTEDYKGTKLYIYNNKIIKRIIE